MAILCSHFRAQILDRRDTATLIRLTSALLASRPMPEQCEPVFDIEKLAAQLICRERLLRKAFTRLRRIPDNDRQFSLAYTKLERLSQLLQNRLEHARREFSQQRQLATYPTEPAFRDVYEELVALVSCDMFEHVRWDKKNRQLIVRTKPVIIEAVIDETKYVENFGAYDIVMYYASGRARAVKEMRTDNSCGLAHYVVHAVTPNIAKSRRDEMYVHPHVSRGGALCEGDEIGRAHV